MASHRIGLAVGDRIATIVAGSNLRDVTPAALAALMTDARTIVVQAGSTIHAEGEQMPHLELVLSGLVRVLVTAPDGRTMTVRYCRPGAILGAVSLFAKPFSLPASIQALVDSDLLAFRPDVVRRLARTEETVAAAMLAELGERVLTFIGEIPGGAFASVRQRVARHLLDLASDHQRGSELVAPVSQQELADAAGSVREVVVRVLRELREDGVVQTGRAGIRIAAPERLLAETYAEMAGTAGELKPKSLTGP